MLFAAAAYLVTWLAAAILLSDGADKATLLAVLSALLFGGVCWTALGHARAGGSGRVAVASATGAAVGLVVGFVIGFIGPMLLDPNGAQGPMLGLFVTGPLGMLAGAAVALVRAASAGE